MDERNGIKIFVSSTVYGVENDLTTICSYLDALGYTVMNSHFGTIPVDFSKTAFQCCLEAVDECDFFFGIIQPKYGSGKDGENPKSITHQEFERAVELNKPRLFMADYRVVFARRFRDTLIKALSSKGSIPKDVLSMLIECVKGVQDTKTVDMRTIEMYELASQKHSPNPAITPGNWVQEFHDYNSIMRFLETQFTDVDRIKRMINAHK